MISNIPYILVKSSHFTCKHRWDFIATISTTKDYFPASDLFLFIIYFILSLICITCSSQKEQRNTIIWHLHTKSPVCFFFSFYFKFCWSILQFSCFLSKDATAKVKQETSFEKSLKQFLQQTGESQRHKSCYFEIMKEVKVTEKP